MSFHLLDTFLYRASIAPEHTALVDIRHTSRDRYEEQRISYGQLKQCIELITAYFKQVNIGHSTAVVVYLDSSWELVAIMLSLWMVRAIYIPANAENVEAICNRWSVTHLLGRTMWSNNSNNQVWHATPIDIGADIDVFHYTRSVDDQSSCLHSSNNFLNNTAYIAHTSGTTRGGQGCGLAVQVPYHVLDANLQSISARLRLMHSPTVLWSSPPTFDPSFVELGLALSDYTDSEQSRSSCIGQLVIIPTTLRRTPHLLARIISDTRVTLLMMTPSLFMSLNSVFVKQLLQGKYKCIRDIILGGEPFPITWLTTHSDYLNENDSNNDEDEDEDDDTLRGRASKRRKQHDHASVSENRHQSALYPRLWNIYGTTECSIWATLHQVDLSTDLAEGVPLGTPLSGITLSIHERKDKQSMKGQSVGELVITVDDSRCCRIDDETEPIYERDTGDLVRRDNASQRVYYEGRVDRQIKRWGHRIQLEDIERQIMSCSNDIEQCCVLLVNPSTNDKHIHSLSMARIVAFLELKHDNDDIRHQVQSKIEEKSSIYARPDHYVILPTMPLTSNGKINMTELRQSISVDALSYNNVMHKDSMLPMTICNIRHHVWQLLDHLLERWTLGTHLEDDKINQQQKWLDSLLHDSIATFIIKVHQSLSNLQIDINKIDEQTRKYSDISTAANVNITGTIDVFNLSFINDSIIKRASVNRISSSVSSFSSKGQIRWRMI
ncbi:hypothetical protein BDF22DRAFT_8357 [Syncephalis plumigaleata]|nr:hypothetical protein BDF22DRAFT_8357 [Syncephalis plumigaleata]